MATVENLTPAMVDAGVRALLGGVEQRTPAQIVCDVFTQMTSARSRPPAALSTRSPNLRRFVDTRPQMTPEDSRHMDAIR
jgi:hypothetical protein